MPRKKGAPSRVPVVDTTISENGSIAYRQPPTSMDLALIRAGYDDDDIEFELSVSQRDALFSQRNPPYISGANSSSRAADSQIDESQDMEDGTERFTQAENGASAPSRRSSSQRGSALADAMEDVRIRELESAAYFAEVAKRARRRKRARQLNEKGKLVRRAASTADSSSDEEPDAIAQGQPMQDKDAASEVVADAAASTGPGSIGIERNVDGTHIAWNRKHLWEASNMKPQLEFAARIGRF